MMQYMLTALLFGPLCWGQAITLTRVAAGEAPTTHTKDSPQSTGSGQDQQTKSTDIGPETAVITINGLCSVPLANGIKDSNCRTVLTETQFSRVLEAVQPNMPARARREFAMQYANALVMAKWAEQMGLDSGEKYEEQLKLARIQILARELNKALQAKVSQISDKDVEDYYRDNRWRFETAELMRIDVPKSRRGDASSKQKSTTSDRQDTSTGAEEAMKEEVARLHARALGGEDFEVLQKDAAELAGTRSLPALNLSKLRRTSLPPNQQFVMDLKPGEISSVIADANGYIIYKMKAKDTMPLAQAREEIRALLRAQRMRNEMEAIQESATPTLNEEYFNIRRTSK